MSIYPWGIATFFMLIPASSNIIEGLGAKKDKALITISLLKLSTIVKIYLQ